MKAIIFAGGAGTRLWPLSRKKSPKQFEKIINGKSTLQIMTDLLSTFIDSKDIFVSTSHLYEKNIKKQLPKVPSENIIKEPVKKDTGPAVAYACFVSVQKDGDSPIAIVWGDHVIKNKRNFVQVFKKAEEVVKKNPNTIVFVAQKPRYPATTLGWIKTGKVIDNKAPYLLRFEKFVEKPDKDTAEKYMVEGNYAWNLGYFITTPNFMLSLFKKYAPEIYKLAKEAFEKGKNFEKFKKIFEKMPEISVDYAVLEKLPSGSAYVIVEDLGWTDVGTWESLKSALEKSTEDNITSGDVLLENCRDALVYNFAKDKLIVGIDLEDIVIVDADDALLVAKKSSADKIKKIVKMLAQSEYEKLT